MGKRTITTTLLALVGLALVPSGALAAGLGRLAVQSGLGQPLRAEIASGFPGLPPPQSVSFRLIEDWYDAASPVPLRATPGVTLWSQERR